MSNFDLGAEPHLVAKAVGGTWWTAAEQVGNAALRLGTVAVLARLLSPAEFGLIAAALLIAEFAVMFSEVALGQALIQRRHLTREHVRVAFTVMFLLGLLCATAVAFAAPAIATFFEMPLLERIVPVLAVLILIRSASAISIAMLSRESRFRYLALARLPCTAFGYSLVAIGLAIMGAGVWALVFGTICRDILLFLAFYAAVRHDVRPSLDRRALKDLAGFSVGQTLVRFTNYIAQNGDYAVVGYTLSAQALGNYSRAYQLMMFPVAFTRAVSQRILFPLMASVQQDSSRLASAYLRCLAADTAVVFPLSAIISVCAEDIIHVFLGSQWDLAITPFAILSMVLVFRSARHIANAASTAQGASFRLAWRQSVYAFLVIFGSLIGSWWGIDGVAVAVSGAIVIYYLLSAHLANRLLRVSWRRFGIMHVPGLATAAIVGLVLVLSEPFISAVGSAFIEIGVSLSLATAVLAALYSLAPTLFLGREALDILATAIRRIKRARLLLRSP